MHYANYLGWLNALVERQQASVRALDHGSAAKYADQPDCNESHYVERTPDRVSGTCSLVKPIENVDGTHVCTLLL